MTDCDVTGCVQIFLIVMMKMMMMTMMINTIQTACSRQGHNSPKPTICIDFERNIRCGNLVMADLGNAWNPITINRLQLDQSTEQLSIACLCIVSPLQPHRVKFIYILDLYVNPFPRKKTPKWSLVIKRHKTAPSATAVRNGQRANGFVIQTRNSSMNRPSTKNAYGYDTRCTNKLLQKQFNHTVQLQTYC